MSETPDSIMLRLRNETRDLHTHAETRQLQQEISRGQVTREAFSAYLGQLYLAHQALENALGRAASTYGTVSGLATDERMRIPDLEKDLAYYGVDLETLEPLSATNSFVSFVSHTLESDPVALLGALYVLEGSTNGGKFLARVLRQVWQAEDGDGLAYFDPYGEEQPRMWATFKKGMDAADFETSEQDAILAAARETFTAIADVSDEVYRQARVG